MVNIFFSKYCLFMILLRSIYSIQMLTFDWMTRIFNILLKFYLSILCVHLFMYVFEHMFHGMHGESENNWWELAFSFYHVGLGNWTQFIKVSTSALNGGALNWWGLNGLVLLFLGPFLFPLLFIFLISMIQLLLCTLKLVSHVQSQCLGTGFKGLQADRESFFPYVFLFLNSNNIWSILVLVNCTSIV